MSPLELQLVLTVIEGKDLVPKDRALKVVGPKTTSDPFVLIYLDGKQVGRSQVQARTLEPKWNETFTLFTNRSFPDARAITEEPTLLLRVMDKDSMTDDDPMGTVTIPVSMKGLPSSSTGEQWLPLEPGDTASRFYCKNVTGSLRVSLATSIVPKPQSGLKHVTYTCT
ncbi:Synaptotagmin-7 [Seminavis robusta]|uniref:Synaptotagmin-7 n=1 Tax=Seminavis robusta TaxID=568900 RepID=A0A9N8EG79_9STRA|nr:Synaptotagmin-7 [Seminavis robusta]|eukprot:Sro953_g224180.1 Synaptotagmin-7 (168) ;mRNA; r:9724-10227